MVEFFLNIFDALGWLFSIIVGILGIWVALFIWKFVLMIGVLAAVFSIPGGIFAIHYYPNLWGLDNIWVYFIGGAIFCLAIDIVSLFRWNLILFPLLFGAKCAWGYEYNFSSGGSGTDVIWRDNSGNTGRGKIH